MSRLTEGFAVGRWRRGISRLTGIDTWFPTILHSADHGCGLSSPQKDPPPPTNLGPPTQHESWLSADLRMPGWHGSGCLGGPRAMYGLRLQSRAGQER